MCRSRIALLRALNPSVPIYGLFGGSKLERSVAKMLLDLEGLYVSTRPERWNWQHSDLAVAAWYREVGSRVPFDVAHVIEWDLLLLAPLQSLYAHVPQDTVGLTALTPVSVLEHEWTWLRREESRREWDTLLSRARADWGYNDVPHGCLGPGPCFPRAFLEAYAALGLQSSATTSCACRSSRRFWASLSRTHGFVAPGTGSARIRSSISGTRRST